MSATPALPVHGLKGAYVGGDFVPIEECDRVFACKDMTTSQSRVLSCASSSSSSSSASEAEETCEKSCATCPRSRSRPLLSSPATSSEATSSSAASSIYDVVIVGAGCIGASVARELSRTTAHVLLIEAGDDVTQGATKGNSGIVHAGYDDTPGSVRAKFCWPGNQMFAQLDRELHFGYQRSGSLVVARGPDEEKVLEELMERGHKNGVQNLRIIGQEELRRREPHIHPKATAALYSPDAGTLTPYEFSIALAENAADNGVEVRIRRRLVAVERDEQDGLFSLTMDHWEPRFYCEEAGLTPLGASGDSGEHQSKPATASGEHQSKPATPASASTTKESKSAPVSKSSSSSSSSPSPTNSSLSRFVMPVAAACLSVFTASNLFGVENLAEVSPVVVPAAVLCSMAVVASIYQFLHYTPSSSSSIGSKSVASASSSTKKNQDAKSVDLNNLTVGADPEREPREAVSLEDMRWGGSGSKERNNGVTVEMETVRARYVVNCAGIASDRVANMIGDRSFSIKPRLGEYLLLHKDQGHLVNHILFPVPDPIKGKGVLVQRTLWGNLILGPTARDTCDAATLEASADDINAYILSRCRHLIPDFDTTKVIHSFSGARAKNSRGDWIIEPSAVAPNFIHAAGIDSPGLAGSPAIALEVVRLLKAAGLNVEADPHFNPLRAPLITPKDGWRGIRCTALGKAPESDPRRNVLCKCEKVTEQEVLECLRRSLPVDNTQAVRKRVRAGMGHCQGDPGNYGCEQRVAEVLARELGYSHPGQVGRRNWPATSTLPQRWPTAQQKSRLHELGCLPTE